MKCPDDEAASRSSPSAADFAPFQSRPKARIGSLPFTGAFTLFRVGDPDNLGTHHYHGMAGGGERHKGIIYTRHGGFIDIAHVRKTIDWTAYHYVRIRYALSHGWRCVVLPSKEPSVYYIRFSEPPPWAGLPPSQRQAVIDEAAITLAQRLTITQTTWHEIMTWFGHSSIPGISEKSSAFTYDDTTSHILGARIAGAVLRDKPSDYDLAVTRHLRQELGRLGAVPPQETLRAIEAVHGKWWEGSHAIKRQLDLGVMDGEVTPWIVPGFTPGDQGAAEPFVTPSLGNIMGYDLRHFARIEVQPRVLSWAKIRAILPDHPERVDPDKHFRVIINYIRTSRK